MPAITMIDAIVPSRPSRRCGTLHHGTAPSG